MTLESKKTGIPDSPLLFIKPYVARLLENSETMSIHKEHTHKPLRAGRLDRYTIPIIVPSDYAQQPLNNQTRNWYILFRYRRIPGEKMRKVQKKIDLNSYHGRAKVKRAEQLRKAYEMWLRDGGNPFAEEIKVEEAPDNEFGYIKSLTIPKALDLIFKLEEPGWRDKTASTYKSSRRVLEKFMRAKGWLKRTVAEFNKSMAKTYSDWLLAKKYDLTTHNNHMRMAGTFFGFMVEREVIDINPFARIKKKRDGDGGHLPFNGSQVKEIKEHCRKNYPAALLFTEFTLETLMRSAELRKMQIMDIDFDKGVIAVVNNKRSGRMTKDKQSRWIEISKEMLHKLKKHCADYPHDYLVFGRGFKPCSFEDHTRRGWLADISRDYTDILRKLNFGPEFTLYSLRHTGAASKAGEGLSIYKLMQILGHSSLDVTEKYLRGLGMYMQ